MVRPVCVGGDDQVVCVTRGTGPADMGEQATGWVVAADDGDRLTALDGIERVRVMPGCLGCGHGLHEARGCLLHDAPSQDPVGGGPGVGSALSMIVV